MIGKTGNNKTKKTCIVVGLGRFGKAVCERLTELGESVIGVDRVRARVEEMSEVIDLAAQLDATDEDALVKAGAREADIAVVAIGESIEASILATTILIGLDVPVVTARAQNALHARVLAKIGASRVFFPERDLGKRVADQISHPVLEQFTELPGSDFLVGEIAPLEEMAGKSLVELEFRSRYNAVVLLVKRGESSFLPKADTVIEKSDRIVVAARRQNLRDLAAAVEKPEGNS
ncbi:MAG: potassium channel family protein [Thermovirgaceae bacterium]